MVQINNSKIQGFWSFVIIYLFSIALFFAFINKPFFWDKDILTSAQAHWFYQNGLHIYSIPDSLNTGHPPFLGALVSISWILLGQHLWSAHIIMLPFIIGFIFQTQKLCKILGLKNNFIVMLLILADTSLLVQFIMVSEDLILMFFFVCAINSLLENNKLALALALCGLAVVNMRGMFICVSMFVFYIYKTYHQKSIKQIILSLWIFLPGALLAFSFLLFHYIFKGWIVQNVNSPWAECYKFAGFNGVIRNVFIVGWRYIDFGKIIYWVILVAIVFRHKSFKFLWDEKLKDTTILFVLLVVTLTPSMLYGKVLSDHRYIIPTTFIFSILVIRVVQLYAKKTYLLYGIIGLFLLSGNFWIYPDKVAKGWPSTMAHIPFHKLYNQMIIYVENNKIDFNSVGSLTPCNSPLKYIYVNNDERSFSQLDMEKNKYVLYTNISNEFSDEDIEVLKTQWSVEYELHSMGVKVILYKRTSN